MNHLIREPSYLNYLGLGPPLGPKLGSIWKLALVNKYTFWGLFSSCEHECQLPNKPYLSCTRGGGGVGENYLEGGGGGRFEALPLVGGIERRDPRHRFAAPPSDWGGSHRAGGGGVASQICIGGKGCPIRICLFQTLLGRKPRRISLN